MAALTSLDWTVYVCRYAGIGHLGPFEAPEQIAGRVILSFMYADSSETWDSLPEGRQVTLPRPRL